MIRPEDDSFHERSDDPHWNESSWFNINVPELKLDGWIYFFHRPNMNLSAGGAALWGPGAGEEMHNCHFYAWDEYQALPPDADMYNFALANGIRSKCIEPLKSYDLSYDNQGCQLDLNWEAIMEPKAAHLKDPARMDNPGMEGWGSGHYDHVGRMRGAITLDGERIPVDCFSQKDHSWGPRTLESDTRLSFMWAVSTAGNVFNAWSVSDVPMDEDPYIGTTERVTAGYYIRDGIVGDIVSGERRCVERGSDGRPLLDVVDAVDHLGRTLHAEGRSQAWLKYFGYTKWFWWWDLAKWEFDGHEAWGEAQCALTLQHKRRLERNARR